MTDPDPAWAEGQAQYDALVRELAETLDLDAGVADALRRAELNGETP